MGGQFHNGQILSGPPTGMATPNSVSRSDRSRHSTDRSFGQRGITALVMRNCL